MRALIVFFLLCVPTYAQEMHLSPEVRAWYRNPDGSCVQCSLGMIGCQVNDLNMACLLWDTEFGPAERGGSWPQRVADYCNRRGIKVYNITGWPNTKEWMKWAVKTGRFAAIGAGTRHFQTLYGYDEKTKEWLVCNNNSTHKIDRYSDREFEQLHLASGPWVVVPLKASSPPPELIQWWEE